MDNSTTTWIMVALLLLLIGAAIFMLLRRPGGGDGAVDSRDSSAVGDRDVVAEGRDLGPGTTAPEIDASRQAPARDRHDGSDEPFDQHAVAQPVGDERRDDGATAASYGTDVRGDEHRTDDAPGTEETAYVVREDDHEPASPSITEEKDPYAAPVDDTRTTAAEDTPYSDVRPLSSEDIDDGARHEPLPAEETTASQPTGDDGGQLAEHGYHEDTTRARTAVPDETDHSRTDVAEPVVDQDHEVDRDWDRDRDRQARTDVAEPVVDRDQRGEQDGAAYGAAGATAAGAVAHDLDDRHGDSAGTSAPGTVDADRSADLGHSDDHPSEAGGAVFTEAAYGPGSAEPLEDGTGPAGWTVKGNTGSMLFHTEESPSWDAVRAEVWFESEEAAKAAGFAHWDRRRR